MPHSRTAVEISGPASDTHGIGAAGSVDGPIELEDNVGDAVSELVPCIGQSLEVPARRVPGDSNEDADHGCRDPKVVDVRPERCPSRLLKKSTEKSLVFACFA